MMSDESRIEQVVAETETQVGGSDGPYLVHSVIRTIVAYSWNPGYNPDSLCKCGDPYYRHFDTYENMNPIGCKYCDCRIFQPKE